VCLWCYGLVFVCYVTKSRRLSICHFGEKGDAVDVAAAGQCRRLLLSGKCCQSSMSREEDVMVWVAWQRPFQMHVPWEVCWRRQPFPFLKGTLLHVCLVRGQEVYPGFTHVL
jgi:hypothetical protein